MESVCALVSAFTDIRVYVMHNTPIFIILPRLEKTAYLFLVHLLKQSLFCRFNDLSIILGYDVL